MTDTAISAGIGAADPHPRKRVRVLDTDMSYVDTGRGDPIVFLHGNPTSSYLWRNIIPYVSTLGRCLAPDLVGMGRSGKSPTKAYRFDDHARYLDAWFETLGLTRDVTLVVHDWGSALGFHRAARFPAQIQAIAYMEAIASPRRWEDFGDAAGMFRALRSPQGERMIFEENFFVETILPRIVARKLSAEEMDAYRAPFRERDARLPTLAWPRQIPIDGDPAEVTAIVERYGAWLAQTTIPKLLILGDPGALIAGRTRDFCRTWPNQREVTVPGRHFLPEDSPHQIGAALAEFVTATRTSSNATEERTRPMKLSFTRIATRDVAKLAAFYRDVIGISPAGRDDYVEFATPTSGLAIVSQRAMDRQGADFTAPAANRSVILDFEVEDVDRERARLAGIVGKFVLEPTNQPWGNRSMLFRDPDGNLINFFAPIDRAAHE